MRKTISVLKFTEYEKCLEQCLALTDFSPTGDSFCFLMALSSLASGGGEQKWPVFLLTVSETFPYDAKLVLEPLGPNSEHPHRAVLLLCSYR